jgi:hypothetical protein
MHPESRSKDSLHEPTHHQDAWRRPQHRSRHDRVTLVGQLHVHHGDPARRGPAIIQHRRSPHRRGVHDDGRLRHPGSLRRVQRPDRRGPSTQSQGSLVRAQRSAGARGFVLHRCLRHGDVLLRWHPGDRRPGLVSRRRHRRHLVPRGAVERSRDSQLELFERLRLRRPR